MGSRMFGFRSFPFFDGKLILGNLLFSIHHAGFTHGKPPLPTKTTHKMLALSHRPIARTGSLEAISLWPCRMPAARGDHSWSMHFFAR